MECLRFQRQQKHDRFAPNTRVARVRNAVMQARTHHVSVLSPWKKIVSNAGQDVARERIRSKTRESGCSDSHPNGRREALDAPSRGSRAIMKHDFCW
jgi:hypothetical protein